MAIRYQGSNLNCLAIALWCFSALVACQIDQSQWLLELPFKTGNDVTRVSSLSSSFQKLPYYSRRADGVYVFVTPAGAPTTKGSHYPRTELREMKNGRMNWWSPTEGTHTLEYEGAVLRMGKAKPDVVVGQIHDRSDDILQIRFREGQAQIAYLGDSKVKVVDNNYVLGERFKVRIKVRNGECQVFYNDFTKPAVTFKFKTESYFKVGCYLQTNPSKGDSPKTLGEVLLYSAKITHS